MALVRLLLSAVELVLWLPLRLARLALSATLFNPHLGPLRYLVGAGLGFVAFAVLLVYVLAPVRAYTGRIYQGEAIRYAAERWLATAIYDASDNFVGTFDPNLDSNRDLNTTGRPIELDDHVANPDHKSIPVREVPEHYWRCLVYHEDRYMGTWLNPFGIDLTGVLKIPLSTARRTLATGRPRLGVGGSTLPMQLARVIYKTPPGSHEGAFTKLRRKLAEWWIAPVIYAELTRGGDDTQLRQWAANHLWLAQRAGGGPLHGVEMTARVVFGKEAADLTIAEQYVLASAVNRPIILQDGTAALNKVRTDHWRYITEVRANQCANRLLDSGSQQAEVLFDLVKMASGPPDPVLRPKLQEALEEYAPQAARHAMANPAIRANILIPEARYGVREEMKNEFGFNWRQHVREVNLTVDAIENRTFHDRMKEELGRLNARLAPKLDPAFTLDPAASSRTGGGKRMPDVIVAAANERGEIVRYFEVNENASYFGSPTARSGSSGKYEADREVRRIASIGKMIAAVAVANEGRDGPETLYADSDAPETGLETCRKGNGSTPRGRAARVAFACSLNRPLETRLAQLGQEPVRALIRELGLTMPRSSGADATPATTAAVRGFLAASPQKVHQMSGAILAALSGQPGRPVPLPSLVRRWDLNEASEEAAVPRHPSDVVPARLIRPHATGLLRTLLQAPLCYRAGGVAHGTLKSLSNWCAETRADLKLHFAKTGTDVTEDPNATVDVWISGGIQFASGPAYSYVVVAGTANGRQPWARSVHAADIAPIAELLLQELAEDARKGGSRPARPAPVKAPGAGTPVAAGPRPATVSPPATTRTILGAAQRPRTPGTLSDQARRIGSPGPTARTAAPRERRPAVKPWELDESTRRSIFNFPSS